MAKCVIQEKGKSGKGDHRYTSFALDQAVRAKEEYDFYQDPSGRNEGVRIRCEGKKGNVRRS